jgi:hypothetical protein
MLTFRTVRCAALAFATTLPLTGCFETFSEPYDGPTVVEFEQVAGRYSATVTEGDGLTELRVNLIGPQQGTDVTINVAVDDASTAVEGTHYAFPEGAQVTIPANSSFGSFPINVLDDSLPDGESGTLILELAGSQDGSIEGADNLDDFILTIEAAEPPAPDPVNG